MALCRCGAFETKPFCDGTHSDIGFSDEKREGRLPDKRDDFAGKGITIHDNRAICSHAGACTNGLPHVWRMKSEPWIDPDGDGAEAIIDTIRQCPSGALSYTIEGTLHQDQERTPAILVSDDAPYEVTGGVELLQVEWGEGASKEHYALCRCGASKNKPFCDGTHWSAGFKDDQTDALAESGSEEETQTKWHKVAEPGKPDEGSVTQVTAGTKSIALSRIGGTVSAIDGTCPHQGGAARGRNDRGRLCPMSLARLGLQCANREVTGWG